MDAFAKQSRITLGELAGLALVAGLLATVFALAAWGVPAEATMGDAQRVLYVHVPMAWLALAGFVLMATTSIFYLATRKLYWDRWSSAATELGWLACGLTLATGSLWALEAWGTAWTWDPRLTSSFVLWLIYGGCLVARRNISDERRRAQVSSVLACVGAADVPLVIMATRWFRGIHPVAPEMEMKMRIVLLFSLSAFSMLFALLLVWRKRQIDLESLLRAGASHLETPALHSQRPY